MMAWRFRCPHCGITLQAPEHPRGADHAITYTQAQHDRVIHPTAAERDHGWMRRVKGSTS